MNWLDANVLLRQELLASSDYDIRVDIEASEPLSSSVNVDRKLVVQNVLNGRLHPLPCAWAPAEVRGEAYDPGGKIGSAQSNRAELFMQCPGLLIVDRCDANPMALLHDPRTLDA